MGHPPRQRPKRLAAKLLTIRHKLGISQIKMARRLSLPDHSYHRISEYESGRREPNLLLLLRYARVGNVTLESLLDDEMELTT